MGTWHLFHLLIRVLEALVGIFCLATAILLYPDQEGKIQSALEEFWVRVDDYHRLALSRATAFMTQVAVFETRILDRVFGQKLLSEKAVLASFCLASTTIIAIHLVFVVPTSYAVEGVIVLAIAWVTLNLDIRVLRWVAVGWLSLLLVFSLLVSGDFDKVGVLLPVVLTIGFVFDIGFVVVTRRILAVAAKSTSALAVALLIALNLFLAALLISPIPLGTLVHDKWAATEALGVAVFFIGVTNIFDGLMAALFVFLATLLLVHRLLWPLLNRTLFRFQEAGTKGRRGILTAIGIALLSTSVIGEKFPDLLKEVIKSLGG